MKSQYLPPVVVFTPHSPAWSGLAEAKSGHNLVRCVSISLCESTWWSAQTPVTILWDWNNSDTSFNQIPLGVEAW